MTYYRTVVFILDCTAITNLQYWYGTTVACDKTLPQFKITVKEFYWDINQVIGKVVYSIMFQHNLKMYTNDAFSSMKYLYVVVNVEILLLFAKIVCCCFVKVFCPVSTDVILKSIYIMVL